MSKKFITCDGRFRWADSIYPVRYNENIILLDLLLDRYIILDQNSSDIFIGAVALDAHCASDTLELLIKSNIIIPRYGDTRTSIIEYTESFGIFDLGWKIQYKSMSQNIRIIDFLEAYYYLLKIVNITKKHYIKGIVSFISDAFAFCPGYKIISTVQEQHYLESVINKACFFYTRKITCLEWSAVYTLMALRRKWDVKFIIGVQNYPFLAHAWPEVSDRVIGNNPDITNQLSHILVIPQVQIPIC